MLPIILMIMMKVVLVTVLGMPGLTTPVAVDAKEFSLSSAERPKVSS